MLTPFLNHWYVNFVPESHSPGTAVSVRPTDAVPEIEGVGVSVNKYPTLSVALVDFLSAVKPGLDAVTVTESVCPRSAEPGR